jgi:hypothetical protein
MNRNEHDTLHSDDVVRCVTGLFHRLNSVLPIDQILISVLPETPVHEALALLGKHGFSQLPVIVGQQVLGLFSYRSFSQALIKLSGDAKNHDNGDTELSCGVIVGTLSWLEIALRFCLNWQDHRF